MRVLLVNSNRERAPQPAIPLGLCLVASSLASRDFQVRVLDLCFSPNPSRDLATAIGDWRPDAIGLSIRNLDNGDFLRPRSYVVDAATLALEIRSLSQAKLVIGGPAVSIVPAELLHALQADFAIAGDGEEALPALLQRVQAGEEEPSLPGIYVRKPADPSTSLGGKTVLPYRPLARTADIETLPFAQVANWIDLRRYLQYDCPMPVQSKRGCALECIYCTYCQVEGPKYRFRAPQTVAQEMWEAKGRWKVGRFDFVDSTFNHPLDHALALCQAIIDCRLGAKLQTTGLHPGSTSRELIQLMKNAGFESVVCTPDSGSEPVLERLKKGFSLDDVAHTASWTREAGLPVLWSFVFGAPGETQETVRATIRFAEAVLGPQDRMMCTLGLRVYPGTELARTAVDEGIVPAEANLLKPAFYFSPEIAPARVLQLLDRSKLRRQMVYLTSLQSTLVPIGLRLRHALHLSGPAYRHVPLLSLLTRLTRGVPRKR